MADKIIKSVELLPEFLRTNKNSKFLSSTLDQLIQKPQLERIDGYVGSTLTVSYSSTQDIYLKEDLPLRQNYQLEPALVVKSESAKVNDVVTFDDLINEIKINGGKVNNLDRLFRTKFYSYKPHIDWDKFVNYQEYYWLPTGPSTIDIASYPSFNVDTDIVGQETFTTSNGIKLSNGMKVKFDNDVLPVDYLDKEYYVEGVGKSITLVDVATLVSSEVMGEVFDEVLDVAPFDTYPFDNFKTLPLNPEYVTINRASKDLNPWSRYNRWVHKDVIKVSAESTDQVPVYPIDKRARRPIIEFEANIKLFNFGSNGIPNIDFVDYRTTNAFDLVHGSAGHHADGILLEEGNTVIFPNDIDENVRNKIYEVTFVTVGDLTSLQLIPIFSVSNGDVCAVNKGLTYKGSSWWFHNATWILSQQRTAINQAPLFDLFDADGNSFADGTYYATDFKGTKIFGYDIGTGVNDPILGFPLKYRNSIGVGSYLFRNYFTSETITKSTNLQTVETISTGVGYIKIDNEYFNVWTTADEYEIPILDNALLSENSSYYEPPLGLTNNPLNGPIASLTLSDVSDHVKSMIVDNVDFEGSFPGAGNIRDLEDITPKGRRLISNINPMAFAHLFMGKQEHSVLFALSKAADLYNQFKFSFLKKLIEIDYQLDPVDAVDLILKDLNRDKDLLSPYYLSDMVPYGSDKVEKVWVVKNIWNTIYPLSSDFSLTELSTRSVLIYLNNAQLVHGLDYVFTLDTSVEILTSIAVNDNIKIVEYTNTVGSFVPSTPTKLGLYPKFIPQLLSDDTYLTAVDVIQGHDGSLTVAFGDYRDAIILELEKRIYNNIKVEYKPELFDINSVIPGAFRTNEYSLDEIIDLFRGDFAKWAGTYGVNYQDNSSFDSNEPFTFNYTNAFNVDLDIHLTGSWRAVYKYFYDTDRPHTHPWEMLGLSDKPSWWESEYGPAPYTSLTTNLWTDLETGYLRGPDVTNSLYARSGLSNVIPVDSGGNLIDPITILATNLTDYNIRREWKIGEHGPAETAWRRSSYWPFVVQKILALAKPALYCSLMFDTSRMNLNIANQWTYGTNAEFLKPSILVLQENEFTLCSGFSVYLIEAGLARSKNYIAELKNDLKYLNLNLFYKVGGFVSKDKLQIVIDSIDPTSLAPGAILPYEDFNLVFNISNPITSIGISGIIIQKVGTKFVVKGYDVANPYFTVYTLERNQTTSSITVGGKSEAYLKWESSTELGNTGLTDAETATASSVVGGKFYNAGQIVEYGNRFYRVKISHKSGSSFQSEYFQPLAGLPVKGGATVQSYIRIIKNTKRIPYGSEFDKIQDVYDLIIGYGAWLEDQGFIFDEFNTDLNEVIDWKFTGKEFLYWTTQRWAVNSIITLSPFADQIKFKVNHAVVDNIFNSFYEYSILQANGVILPESSISVDRNEGVCTISTRFSTDGIYFARLRGVQKEHGIVFNNSTIFNDTVYDIETGYRQRRMKLLGFRTGNWNGDYFSPGFVYDSAIIADWKSYTDYKSGDIIRFNGNYYSANANLAGTERFDFNKWTLLGEKPVANLLPNFDYKINQFEDFYSLDIDNFDSAQQKMAQHLTGYTPRVYLNNIFSNPVSQYKFYQGFIREKGTRNSISRLAKASIANLQGEIDYREEWAFRIGHYGSYETFKEIEVPLQEGSFIENPQIINFVETQPIAPNDLIYYSSSTDLVLKPDGYVATETFITTSSGNIVELNIAGYARFDDVDALASKEDDLLVITDNETIGRDDVIWIGEMNNGSWDVVRYVLMPARITSLGMYENDPNQIIFTTNVDHNLSLNNIVSITNTNNLVNGVFRVSTIPESNQFIISTTATTFVSTTNLETPGMLFKFVSTRFENFDVILSDLELLRLPFASKLWINDEGNGNWVVYEKIDNYTLRTLDAGFNTQDFGYRISKQRNSNLFMVSDIGTLNESTYGIVSVYKEENSQANFQFKFGLNNETSTYHEGTYTNFGYALAYDDQIFRDIDEESNIRSTDHGLMIVGAPITSYVKSNGAEGTSRFASDGATASTLVEEGVVKVSSIDPILIEEVSRRVMCSPYPTDYERFGSSVYLANSHRKMLLVGAPQTATTGTGTVYVYWINTSTANTVNIVYKRRLRPTLIKARDKGSQWGYAIAGTNNGDSYAISAPGWFTATGFVNVYTGVTPSLQQTIHSPFRKKERFGESLAMSATGEYLFISAIDSKNSDKSVGKVAVYQRPTASGTYTHIQTLINPIPGLGMKFGQGIDLNDDASELVITALGTNNWAEDIFDSRTTIEDYDSTTFYDKIVYSGMAYVYNRKLNQFKLVTRLKPDDYPKSGTNYGFSVAVNQDSVYVGAPSVEDEIMPNRVTSRFYQFYKKDTGATSWNRLRYQEELVVVENIQKVTLIDTFNETVIDYLDVIDPIKGKIAGIADQDLKYKSSFDPAVYSIGTSLTVNDTNSNWLDEHVGELWWDVSTAKFVWYEQGDLEYRKNNWGRLFPGSSIDVYEWVGTEYLPSEWSEIADTTEGLSEGISGQPKYADNTILSVKQIYNAITNSFTNYYFYWVKNKVTIPNVKNRRSSAYQISSIIANPTLYGLKFAAPIAKDSLILSNVGGQLVENRIHLNLNFDIINNKIPRHTEWLLLQEGAPYSVPNAMLEKKLVDSLLGHDSLGNIVPDPDLSQRASYGISIRPRQSMFKNRLEALRNLIEFSNSILMKERITGNYSFQTLNLKEEIPNYYSYEYDLIVEDNEGLFLVDVEATETAQITCSISNGRIVNAVITNPGYGYLIKPKVTVSSSSGQGAEISVEIDNDGKLVSVSIVNSGQGYASIPTITVRPFSVIVQADQDYGGKWTKYVYDKITSKWTRLKTQSYNTPLYWDYTDWISEDYNQYVDYSYTVNSIYDLESLNNIITGQYVKVRNNGQGNYIILSKSNESGTYGNGYDILYVENGTIQFNNNLWNYTDNNLGFDQSNLFDQALFSQSPDIELANIIKALRNDIFVGDLKINWNLFFFKAVKYALSEQKLLDWAFKTSFINVINYAGNLDQRPIYKLKTSENYENYIKEVKPYHTNIRSFTENYSLVEETSSFTTDFDLPAYYNTVTGKFEVIEVGNSLLTQYPWKSWYDNYTTTGTVRTNLIGMRFDRTSRANENSSIHVEDNFKANGTQTEFVLSWLPLADKSTILATIDGAILLTSDYSLVFYNQAYQGYTKKYCKIVFTSFIPYSGQVIQIRYVKSTDLLNAYDRVVNYYTATSSMPGMDPEQLMTGIEYPKTQIVGLPFDASSKWDKQFSESYYSKFGEFVWFDDVASAESFEVIESAREGTDTLHLASVSGISVGQTVNLVSYFSGLQDKTLLFEKLADPEQEITVNEINTLSNSVKLSSTLTYHLNTQSSIIFVGTSTTTVVSTASLEVYTIKENASLLDSNIVGGAWTPSNLTATDTLYYQNLFGIDPSNFVTTSSGVSYMIGGIGQNSEDLIIDGDRFITPNTSYAPEELVPGEMHESIGINVYTKNLEGAPTVLSSFFYIEAGSTSTRVLTIIPPNPSSIYVMFNNQLFDYSTSTNWSATNQFTINWETNEIVVAPQVISGNLGYLIISIGGEVDRQDAGVLDSVTIIANTSTQGTYTSTQLTSLTGIDDVGMAYVTVNGISIPAYSTSYPNVLSYELGETNSYNRRASVEVKNLNTSTTSTVTAWFFGNDVKHFNEAKEEYFTLSSMISSATLAHPPGDLEPVVGQVLVELNTSTSRLLKAPLIGYWKVNSSNIFSIIMSTPLTFSYSDIRVYLNGQGLRAGFDYTLSGGTMVTIDPSIISSTDDVVAIVNVHPSESHEFDLVNDTLTLKNTFASGELRVITFNNHDSMFMRTERFDANPSRRYKISRPVLNERFVWVLRNAVPLISFNDFEILDDRVTIQISDRIPYVITDYYTVISFASDRLATTVLGYRIFNDIFNRTHFKRLSKKNTTYLTRPLMFTDKEIYVSDASVLTKPIVSKNIPGVVIIDGERIEFFKITGNVLSQLRRSTMGTSPAFYCEENSKVIDQGTKQTVPFKEELLIQTTLTNTLTNTYKIFPHNHKFRKTFITDPITTSSFVNDGITLLTGSYNIQNSNGVWTSGTIPLTDQIAVYYGGRLLNKVGTYYHDINEFYDSPIANLTTQTVMTKTSLPITSSIGTSYIVEDTNEVWTYYNSKAVSSFKGYEYRGLKYIPPEFNIDPITQEITLNILEGVGDGIKLSFVKRKSSVWNTTATFTLTYSLMTSETVQARFLQQSPAELPDKYYYGGDPALEEDSGIDIIDDDGKPLEGF